MPRSRLALSFARLALALVALTALAATTAAAADPRWPTSAIRIVVAQAAGGPPDLIDRFIADRLERALQVRSSSTTGQAPAASSV